MGKNEYNSTVEIIKLVANFFASVATAIASFVSIAALVALVTPEELITIQGNKLQVSISFVLISGVIAVLFLAQACLILFLLRGVDND